MRSVSLFTVLVTASTALAACSSSSTDGGSSGSQPTSDAGGGDAGTASDSGSSGGDAGSTALAAPVITMVMPMSGGLHVRWTNKQTDCDAIEGERKSASEAYKVAFTVPDGSVDNKHDGTLTAGTAYTYRVRCKKGSDYSPDSNEKSGTP